MTTGGHDVIVFIDSLINNPFRALRPTMNGKRWRTDIEFLR